MMPPFCGRVAAYLSDTQEDMTSSPAKERRRANRHLEMQGVDPQHEDPTRGPTPKNPGKQAASMEWTTRIVGKP
jgi:hypothetical protein